MKVKIYLHRLLFVGAFTSIAMLSSCNSFLDQAPDDRTQLNDVETIKELITSGYPTYSHVPLFELRSDNYQDRGKIARSPSSKLVELYEFKYVTSISQDSPNGMWRDFYGGVGVANQALRSLDELKGSQNDPAAQEARGEALLLRAYCMYMLAQAFTIPYDPATAPSKLGLPYPTEPEDVLIKHYQRGTLDVLYASLVKDFEEGFELVGSQYQAPKFHFTKSAAAAFGVRLYRTLGDWDKVLKYGRIALGNTPIEKVRQYQTVYRPISYSEKKLRWASVTEDCNLMTQVAMSSWSRDYSSRRFGLTASIRRTLFGSDNFLGLSPDLALYGRESSYNFPKFQEHFQVTNQATGTGYVHTAFVLFSGEEVIFTMAEAFAMKDDYAQALECLQMIVSRWFRGYSPAIEAFKVTQEKIESYYKEDKTEFKPFYPMTPIQTYYVKAITDLKRIIFYHEGQRWFDIRQYNLEVVKNRLLEEDKVEETIIIPGGDPRIAFRLPSTVLGYGIEDNPTK